MRKDPPVWLPMNSEQLELKLDDVRGKLPWDGRSPRSLTRGANLVILGELPTGGPILDADCTTFLKGSPSHGS